MDIKRLTLHAAATALLTFNAERATAVTCPIEITDSSLANQVCNFSANNSVTVTNGGTVGGIAMNTYSPASSNIVVDAGGSIINTTATGISLITSSLTDGIINNGTISTQSIGILASSSSTIAGGITNNGSITTTAGTGIRVFFSSTVSGGITNNGSIIAGSVDEGIAIGKSSRINGNISNTGTINADSGGNGIFLLSQVIINGTISNSGTINAAHSGIGVVVLNTISGDILNSGSITAGSNGIRISNESTLQGSILNTGSISSTAADGIVVGSQTIVSGVSNSGIIRAAGTGIAVTSTSNVTGGISNSGTIQGDINAILVGPASNVGEIDILGQHARVIGAVNAPATDFNITSGAVFSSEGNFDVNNFNIASNSVFNMRNSITTTNALNNSGTLNLGNTLETLTGNYVQNPGGVFQIGISGPNNYGQLNVSGTVDFSQNGNIYVVVLPDASFRAGNIFQIISGNTLIPPANGFNLTNNSFIWNFTPSISNNNVMLTANINPAANTVCLGEYCQGAASTIIGQVANGNSLFSPYALLSTSNAFRIAAAQATPELINENIQVIQSITQSITNIIPMWNNLHGVSQLNSDFKPSDDLWMKPYGSALSQDENTSVDGFNAKAYGVILGKDVQPSADLLLGGAFAAGGDNITGKSKLNGQSINGANFQGMFYGAKKFPHHFYFAAEGLIGYENNESQRSMPLFLSTANGSFSSWFTDIQTQFGWNISTFNQNLILTPELDASFLFINQNNYRESGSAMNLEVASNSLAPIDLGAYTHVAYYLGQLKNKENITLTTYAGLACDVLNNQANVNAAFIAGGPYFSTFGVRSNQLVFRGGLGLSIGDPKKPLSFSVNYDLQAGNNAYNGAASATLIYNFDKRR